MVREQKYIVRMQVVIDANLELQPWSKHIQFQLNLRRKVAEKAKDGGARKIMNEDHSFLMEQARQRTALDYKDYVVSPSDDNINDGSVYGDGELSDGELSGDEEG